MDQQSMKAYEAKCTQESMPRCRAMCPLRLDLRGFLESIAQGKMSEAKKLLEKHLPIPNILARVCDHPCENVCLRKDLGGSLAISKLELSCVEMVESQVKALPRARKSERIGVLGNGLAALVVAYELSKKAYPVTIFHSGSPEDFLLNKFKNLKAEHLQADFAFLAKNGVEWQAAELSQELLEEVKSKYEAIFIDADVCANLAEKFTKFDELSCLVESNIALGGFLDTSPTGAKITSSSKQAAEGRRAAISIERLLGGVSIQAEREQELVRDSALFTPLDKVSTLAKVLSSQEIYSEIEASQEASRCLPCECLACVRECVYLQKYGAYPKNYTRQIFNNGTIVKGQHLANPLINGCTLCGQCTEFCPEHFSMAELCLTARQDMVERKYMPESAFEFALEDMSSAVENGVFIGKSQDKYVFFPGCQLTAARGSQVLASYDFLHREIYPEQVSLYASCCGIPAHWAGEEAMFLNYLTKIKEQLQVLAKPKLIFACANCQEIFAKYLPEYQGISLWEVLDNYYKKPIAELKASFSIHDPCGARHNQAWQKSVRSLAEKMGAKLEEPRLSAEKTACCGYGGAVWSSQLELSEAMAKHRASELEKKALVSCIMCRDNFVKQGKETVHLLDLLPFVEAVDAKQEALSLSARRFNRAKFKQRALIKYEAQDIKLIEPETWLEISDELLQIMEAKHILKQDLEATIKYAEANDLGFLEAESGDILAYARPRKVTFWVRYHKINDSKYILKDAWAHRMVVGHVLPS